MSLSDILKEGVRPEPVDNRPAGIEIRQDLRPPNGGAMTVAPPSYEYPLEVHERPIDGERRKVLELDSVGSSANRVEESLAALFRAGAYPLPVMTTSIDPGDGTDLIELSTLEAPHRGFDAWLRLSEDASGLAFEKSEQGKELALAHPSRLDALLETSAHDLLLGVWDSHQKGPQGQVRIARSLTTTLLGIDPVPCKAVAARVDPVNLPDKEKLPKGTGTLSERGLSSIPPQLSREHVAISEARFLGYLSFPSLRRLGFERYDATQVRTTLALLALYGVLLRAEEGWNLRSGADLIPSGPMQFSVARPDGTTEPLAIDLATARDLFHSAVAELSIQDRKIRLDAGKTLNDLVAKSFVETKKG